ncbi:MAG TPA: pitrilysin family protein [Candidatus Acidoferrales bacterium]|nr:pitrilysin family protein [Candidatus Acidoferrales bacterium]
MSIRPVLIAAAVAASLCLAMPAGAESLTVTRATLPDGLRVVVVHNPLAPVVSTVLNYEVGSDEETIAGEAHALEHMMFRGSATLSSSQLMDTVSLTGGDFDADTEDAITQFYFTVPSQYLEIALHLERSRASGLSLAPAQWASERKAITQEVTQDNSSAIYRLFTKMIGRMLGGTPYAKSTLGTVYDFAHNVNTPQLRAFYGTWYHPNNAVYVIVGDVDGPATIAKIKALWDDLPAAKLPPKPPVKLSPVLAHVYRDSSDEPYTIVLTGYRLPGYDSPDYAASEILQDVLSSQRGALYDLTASGKALYTGFEAQTFQKAAIGVAIGVVPVSVKPEIIDQEMRAVIDGYRKNGIPDDLVEAAKQREIAQLEFTANSIEDQAFEWSQAVAVQGLNSPDDMESAFERVTTADVDRVLRTYVNNERAVAAYAVPKNTGAMSTGGGGPGKENNMVPPSTHQPLPSWAQSILHNLNVPPKTLDPTSMTLANGIRLIVQPESITKTVVLEGEIENHPFVQEPLDQRGINELTTALFPFGTTTYDRVQYQAELDKISANVSAGTDFGVEVLAKDFDRGVQLLADDELHPAFDPDSFAIVKRQFVGQMQGEVTSPGYLTQVALANALYPVGDPYRARPTLESVGSLTLDDVKAWYASAYRPDLTTIVVIGDTTPDAARAVVEKYFGAWTAVGPKPQTHPPAVPPNKPSQVVVPAQGRVQSSVELVELNDLRRTDPGWAALQLANTALSGGFYSSILFHDLREVHGYVYSVSSAFAVGETRSSFHVDYACDPQNIVPAETAAIADLQRMRTTPLSQSDLLRAKALLLGDVPIHQASYDGVSSLFLDYAEKGLPLDQYELDARAYLDATAAQVQAAFAKWVRPDDFVRVVTGPGPK